MTRFPHSFGPVLFVLALFAASAPLFVAIVLAQEWAGLACYVAAMAALGHLVRRPRR